MKFLIGPCIFISCWCFCEVSGAPSLSPDESLTYPVALGGKEPRPFWSSSPPPVKPRKTTLTKLKSAFLSHLLPHTIRQLNQLHKILNDDGLLDSFQSRINQLEENPPERTVPGFYTWLLTQDRKQVFRTVQNLDECLKRLQKWINKQEIWDDEKILFGLQSPEKKEEEEEDEDSQFSAAKFILDLIKILWRIGYKNGYRVGELIHFVDPDGSRLWRIFSVNIGLSLVMNNERAQRIVMPQVADWILEQEPETLKQFIQTGDDQLKKIFDWIDEQGY